MLTVFISGVEVSCTVSLRTVSTGCTMDVSVSELLLGSISGDVRRGVLDDTSCCCSDVRYSMTEMSCTLWSGTRSTTLCSGVGIKTLSSVAGMSVAVSVMVVLGASYPLLCGYISAHCRRVSVGVLSTSPVGCIEHSLLGES